MSIDGAAGDALIGKSIEVGKALLEATTSNNYHWSSERTHLKRSSGKYDINAVDLFAGKVNGHAQRFSTLGAPNLGS